MCIWICASLNVLLCHVILATWNHSEVVWHVSDVVIQNLSHVSFSEANGNVSLQALRADWGIFPFSWSGKEPYCSVFLFQHQSLSGAPAALVGDAVDVVSPQGGEGQGHCSLAPKRCSFSPLEVLSSFLLNQDLAAFILESILSLLWVFQQLSSIASTENSWFCFVLCLSVIP